MAETSLVAEIREGTGKGMARKLRAAGRLPGVVYGRRTPSVQLTLDPRALERLLQSSEAGLNTLIDLRIQGRSDLGEKVVMVKELQRDPVRGIPLHVDLYEVDLAQTVEVAVPVRLVGRPRGVELGGILDHTLREIEMECLPRAIPQAIDVDVSQLDVGDGVHVRDLALPEGVTLRTDPDLPVAHVMAPAVEAAEAEPVAEEAEVVAEGAEEPPTPSEGAEESGE